MYERHNNGLEAGVYLYRSVRVGAVAVLGFCVWGADGADIFVWGGLKGNKRRWRETAIAKGKKPLTTRGSEGIVDAILNISS